MLIENIEIRNYRSLEDVRLQGLGQYNVLIGKNNSGKSSVLNAVGMVTRAVAGPPSGVPSGLITDDDISRSLLITIACRPEDEERNEFISRLSAGSPEGAGLEASWTNSSLARQVEYSFGSEPGQANLFHLRQIRMLAQDGLWAIVHSLGNSPGQVSNPISSLVNFEQLAQTAPYVVGREQIESALASSNYQIHLQSWVGFDSPLSKVRPASRWVIEVLQRYCAGAFFFSPFRHSQPTVPATSDVQLAPDGANLAAVLHTVQSNDRHAFDAIEEFVHAALPGVGPLQSRLDGNQTFVGFSSSSRMRRPIQLQEMGGGVEQLLMVALVLQTTGRDHAIFLEEPEGHLHPGAQRFLLDQLRADGRQVVVATHSPALIDLARPSSIFRTTIRSGRTTITSAANPKHLGDLLDDIGARNGDVLLSDAVLFVEGPSDRDLLLLWSTTLGRSLTAQGVTVVAMGGGEAARGAKARQGVLESISAGSPIPHMFVLDRDERSGRELDGLRGSLGEHLWILNRREIENYLLVPEAVLHAIRDKCRDEGKATRQLENSNAAAVAKVLNATAAGMRGLVLLKRVRAELGTLHDGFLPRSDAELLATRVKDPDLPKLISNAIQDSIGQRCSDDIVSTILQKCRRELAKEWADPSKRLELAPGEELLAGVFRKFGTSYNKTTDGPRIARLMTMGDIPSEIAELIAKAAALASPERS